MSGEVNYRQELYTSTSLLTREEQDRIKSFRIAIPGMGGVGGINLISLVQHGFIQYNISDPDFFEPHNFNRQYGATVSTIGRNKAEVMREKAHEVNPQCDIRIYDNNGKGITENNLEDFLTGTNLVVDSLDFFAYNIRRRLFNRALDMKIPVISAGPIGFSTAYVVFKPGGPNFDEYFGVDDSTPELDGLLRFGLGMAPKMLQRKYMHNPRTLYETFILRTPPSSILAVDLCGAMNTMNAIKILLGKGKYYPAPYYHQFDPTTQRFVIGKRRFRFLDRFVLGYVKSQIQKESLKVG